MLDLSHVLKGCHIALVLVLRRHHVHMSAASEGICYRARAANLAGSQDLVHRPLDSSVAAKYGRRHTLMNVKGVCLFVRHAMP